MNEQKTVWGVADHQDADGWVGAHETREAAEAEAKDRVENDEWDEGWVRVGTYANPADFLPDFDDIMSLMDDRAADNGAPDFIDEPFEADDGAKKELEAFLEQWAKKHLKANWWEVGPVEAELVAKRKETPADGQDEENDC